ncbi:MAG: hypothetical protein B6I36_01445 [Desulfobacteraceae bacterium 4572_35.1]|nr:MAG: hypothetical protein B6I36_01445 [Desulfobacteraceae bacterium 4572_35.1]
MQRKLFLVLSLVCTILCCTVTVYGAIELSRQGRTPQLIKDVYHKDGTPYIAIDDALPALGMSGYWDSVAHVYKIKSPRGRATFFPGGQYLRLGETFYPIKHKPLFIDGRLRVSEDFILEQLAEVLPTPIYYRNLNPISAPDADQGMLDKLFAFLLQKKKSSTEPALRAVAIDPGHGGDDMGTIGRNGIKEKDVVLAVAKKLKKKLKMQLGVPVYLSRDDDYTLSAEQHLGCARHDDVDVFLLLHAQASLVPDEHGVHIYVRPEKDELNGNEGFGNSSMMFALQLSSALRSAGFNVVEVAQAPLLQLVRGNLPTVLIEMGYLSNLEDKNMLNSGIGQQRFADALFVGLQRFANADK